MDNQETCPQCAGTLSNGPSRLVQDACGHKKCRLCLLGDEVFCNQCVQEKAENATPDAQIDCHTAVITYQRKSDRDAKPNKAALDENRIKLEQLDAEIPDVPEGMQLTEPDKPEGSGLNADSGGKISASCSFDSKHQLYTCNFCKKSFTRKSRVKYHKYCNGEKRPFVCDICNRGFIAKSHYTTHLLTHEKTKPYKCTVAGCGKAFSERSKLNRHRATHGNNRPFICQECGKGFKIMENLRTHLITHRKEKPYACTECDDRFSHSSNLKKHLAVHTSERAHMCDQCGKCYKLKWALTLHRRVHAKTRPNKCSTCHRAFVHQKDLARHQMIHTENKAFRCGICGSTFRRQDNLSRHTRNTHPGKQPQIIKCVDTPNAIKVITAPPPAVAKAEVAQSQTAAKPTPPADERPAEDRPAHVPLKLAFKTLSFRSNYNMNSDIAEPKPEHVRIYEKILNPRRDALRTAPTINPTMETNKDCARVFEHNILTPFNAPSHYETSFDNKKHAVIKNIKFKLPDKYTNLNTSREKSTIAERNVTTASTSVIVNTTGNQHQQTV